MLAAFYDRNGPAREVLSVGEIDTPEPGPGEVRVRLRMSGINPSDVKAREGRTRKIGFPRVIPHSDGAGDIDLVGDGVPKGRIGERVWIWNGQWKRPYGTCAQYIVVPATLAVPLPQHVGYDAGACLGIPAMTAVHAVAQASSVSTVLVSGGAGGVGHYAVQFAKARGATVIATVSSEVKAALARTAGADHTIDYRREDVASRISEITGKAGVDAVIEMDLAANAALYPGILGPRSEVVVYGTGSPQSQVPAQFLLVNAIAVKFVYVYELTPQERAFAVGTIQKHLQARTLINNVAMTRPLGEIAAAHEAIEQGAVAGNVVIALP